MEYKTINVRVGLCCHDDGIDKSAFDGLQPNYYHFSCFFKTGSRPSSTTDIEGFELLRLEDQKKIKDKLAKAAAGGSGDASSDNADLTMEYAKSSRAACRKCEEKINKGELRLGVLMDPPAEASFRGKVPWWYHRRCFIGALSAHKDIALASLAPEQFKNHKRISADDLADVRSLFDAARKAAGVKAASAPASSVGKGKGKKGGKRSASSAKKEAEDEDEEAPPPSKTAKGRGRKTAQTRGKATATRVKEEAEKEDEEEEDGAESEEERKFQQQVKLIWKHKDNLSALSTTAIKDALMENDRPTHGGRQKLLDRLVDGLLFGQLQPCSKCGENRWKYTSSGYECRGHISEWEPCTVVTRDPPRSPWIVTEEIRDLDAYEKFKFKKNKRLFHPAHVRAREEATTKAAAMDDDDGDDDGNDDGGADDEQDTGPLSGLFIAIAGRLSQSQPAIKKRITALGGNVHTGAVGSVVTCVLSSDAEVEKETNKKIKDAINFGVPIVSLDFLDDCEKQHKCALLEPHVIKCTSTIIEPSKEKEHVSRLKKKHRAKSGGAMMDMTLDTEQKKTVVVKGRAAVEDPDLALTHHVLEEGKRVWNASLARTDLKRNTNTYYKIQVLVPDAGGPRARACLYRAWGRLGTTQGGTRIEHMSVSAAKSEFQRHFSEKTGGNDFLSGKYFKVPNALYPLDITYDDVATSTVAKGSKTSLARPVAELIELIFDVSRMKSTMKELEVDLTRMPLGKLSRSQLNAAMEVLTELQNIIQDTALSTDDKRGRLLGCSNKFYTYIPHDFGFKSPPPISTEKMIKDKVQMVEDLMNLEVASRILEDTAGTAGEDPLDVYYRKLKTDITAVDKDSEEFKMLKTYVKNTHAKTHRQYDLEVVEAFKIGRHGEAERYEKKYGSLHNKRLLWHGSRLTNYVGILSEGLRIAPPSAPVTGYMFGKGIYLADMVSKSANYCFCTSANNTGLVLLCEAALGNMYERKHAEFVKKLPKGKHSTFGMGKTRPDPKQTITIDGGVQVPLGVGKPSGVANTSLLYNEFIVYDVSQVHMRYLLRLDFKFKSGR
ncbi:hypothetical protein PTSG_05004 [Salpingoeca rosetta]|uniref:Poly [ADP-ribose] polymerase n=1 Tax=Salpingoeca rosetta (strain ATCC 50818 / BSB-021) TaxID=946362 RepID=F2U985_SALR5|nr:uncharacterized protein PTSG_05004 [Salpingoeca rosetta]EGD73288.1 hypothetical protein PTSG_05004 [Salpingoeca rosetta]|eukprot:XP_004994319.1 hypothetical protein PTSG_05004 [Salpingoeca rosetta]